MDEPIRNALGIPIEIDPNAIKVLDEALAKVTERIGQTPLDIGSYCVQVLPPMDDYGYYRFLGWR